MTIVASNSLTVSNVNDGTITHIAYANSADGTDGFTTVYPNLNLLDGTKGFSGTWVNLDSNKWITDGTYKNLVVKKRTTQWQGLYKIFTAPIDGTFTFSAYVKASGNTTSIYRYGIVNGITQPNKRIGTEFDWLIDSVTVTLQAGQTAHFRYEIATANTDAILWTAGHKWEQGSTATPYMPSSSEVTTADWPSFIGQYTDFTQADSTNPSDYTWSLIRGKDGATGPQGPQGNTGPQGPAGPAGSNGNPGTSAINIDLSNKSYNFLANLEVSDSGSVMQAVAGSTTTTFTALQGTAAINITALTCTTTLPRGMTVSIGTLNALSVVVTISVDNTMITPNGGLNFSITAGGVTTIKSFSYSLAINDLTVINLAAINSNLGNVKNIYSHYNGSDGGTYSGTIEINDENIKIIATNDNDSNEVSKTQMNGENGIWHSTKLQKKNSPGVYVLSNWSLTGTTLSFESQQSDLNYPNGYYYASYGIDIHARNIVGDSISQTTDVPWTTLSPKNGFSGGSIQFSVQNGVEFFSIAGLSVPQMNANQWYQAASLPAGSIAIPSINRVYPISGNNNAWDLLINPAGGVFIRCQAAVSATSNLVNGGCGFPIG